MRVKNVSGSTKTYVGQQLTNNQEYDIPAQDLHKWQGDTLVITDGSSGALLIGDGTAYKAAGAEAINFLLGADTTPKDTDGSIIQRPKAAKAGWSYQLHGISIATSTIGGFYNKDDAGNDLGFVTLKLYDVNGTEITTQGTADTDCVKTQVDWCVNHEMEIIGGSLYQSEPPTTDIYFWCKAAPGIANIMFAQGGINLKNVGIGGAINADGRASKYLHPSVPVAGVNKFRLIFKHNAGVKHNTQMLFDLFKP